MGGIHLEHWVGCFTDQATHQGHTGSPHQLQTLLCPFHYASLPIYIHPPGSVSLLPASVSLPVFGYRFEFLYLTQLIVLGVSEGSVWLLVCPTAFQQATLWYGFVLGWSLLLPC